MGGGLLQSQSSNTNSTDNSTPQVKHICGNPEIIHFKLVHKRPVNFAIEAINLKQDNEALPIFGGTSTYTIHRYSDLVNKIMLEIDLPQLNFPNSSNFFWTYGIGNALIETASIYIGGELIEQHTGDMLNIYNELTKSGDEMMAYDDLVGNSARQMRVTEKHNKLYIPLMFWFCKNIGLSLPLISINAFKNVKLVIKFRRLDELIYCNNNSPNSPNSPNSSKTKDFLEMKTNVNIYYSNLSINCKIFADYIFLGDEETIRQYKTTKQKYLIDYITQLGTFEVDNTKNVNKYNITPKSKLIKEIVWVHSLEENIKSNRLFDYSQNNHSKFLEHNDIYMSEKLTISNDTFFSAKLMISNADRIEERDATYFRKICNFASHRKIPRTPSYSMLTGQPANASARQYIYSYSFAIQPEEHQPSGIYPNDVNLDLVIKYNSDDNTFNKTLKVFCTGYKILHISD